MMRRRLLAVAVVILVTIAGRATPAHAYPQWQFTSGATRCNQCHYAPGGGGLPTSFGRDAVGDELSTFPGNGGLLHGSVSPPSWLALGGDLRGAFVAHDVQDPSGPTVAVFPMQADLAARLGFGAGISISGTVGFRGQTRTPGTIVPLQNYQPISASRLISREHYVMWQPEVLGPYLRAGRFYAPFGLRLAEHNTYIRRDLGFDLLEESYNVSGGYVYPQSELHVTAFAPDFLRHIGSTEKGVATMYERRILGDRAAVAVQGRLAFGPGVTRLVLGAVGKVFAERLKTLFLAECDAVQMEFAAAAAGSRAAFVGALGFATLPVRGLMVTILAERNQVDVQVRDAAWTAATALVNWFPYPHAELQVMGRLQFPGGTDTTKTVLLQLHYFL
jgi:hypothetical protein